MALANELLEILVCPESHEPLLYFPKGESGDESQGFLFCEKSRRKYRIEQDIPVMLLNMSQKCSPDEAERIMRRAAELGIAPN